MNFLNNLFSKKEKPISSLEDFWIWFKNNEKVFFEVVKNRGNVEKDFFEKLSPKLNEIKEGFFFLTGMFDTSIAELVITADGSIKNFAFVEDLIQSAPKIAGWKFTALKPPLDSEDFNIEMQGYIFNAENLSFYPIDHKDFPDEIDIVVVHPDYNPQNEKIITNGTFVFLDNFLGELNFSTSIDNLKVVGRENAGKELIPIKKLHDFLNWRQKEFVEKYDDVRRNTEKDAYSVLEAKLENGNSLVATINSALLNWDSKPSHPWISTIEIKFNGDNNNGMPDNPTSIILNDLEDEIMLELKDEDGYLNVGRQTANGIRNIYFACRDFRMPSKVLYKFEQRNLNGLSFTYDIYKDKYWQSLNRFKNSM